jgi:hypothetical protein
LSCATRTPDGATLFSAVQAVTILQDGEIFFNFVFGYLYAVFFPFDLFVLDEGVKKVVTQRFLNQRALLGDSDGFQQA